MTDPKETVLNFLRNLNEGDMTAALAGLAESVAWTVMAHNLPFPKPMTKEYLAKVFAGIDDVYASPLKLEVDGITAEGDRVAVEAKSRAVVKKSGKSYANRYHFLFVVRDSEIQEVKEYMDTLHFSEVMSG